MDDYLEQCVWLWSEDFVTKVLLPIESIKAYLPIQVTHRDFLEASPSSNLVVLLDGVGGKLLSKIDDYLRHFPRADAGETHKRYYIAEFVHTMDEEMLTMMRTEVEKRNCTAMEMVLLHNAIKEALDGSLENWKFTLPR